MHKALYIALLAKGIVHPMHMQIPWKRVVNAANGDVLKLQFFYRTPFYVHLIYVTDSDCSKCELLVDSLRTFYAAKSEENKQFLTVSLQPVSMDDHNLVCKASAVFTYSPVTGGGYCNFNSEDYWSFWWFHQGGICGGPNSGTNLESDAAEEIQKRIMRCKGVLPSNYYYELTTTIPIDDPLLHPIDPNVGPHNYGYSYLYWNSSQYPGFDGCISPQYLNFYLTKIKEYIYNDENSGGLRPVGNGLIDIDLWGMDGHENGSILYFHQARVDYGILRVRPDPREILD